MRIFSRLFLILFLLSTLPFSQTLNSQETQYQTTSTTPYAERLITAARTQVGVTLIYDGSYQKLAFPNGDVPRLRGVCTDVVIRAMRDAHNLDLQSLVNRDMKSAFGHYPKNWNLSRTDRNIDHRRVPNLQTYFKRRGTKLPTTQNAADYLPGDLVTWMLPGNLPHIGIVSNRMNAMGDRPLIIHNIGWGTRENDNLFTYEITGHYRPEKARF